MKGYWRKKATFIKQERNTRGPTNRNISKDREEMRTAVVAVPVINLSNFCALLSSYMMLRGSFSRTVQQSHQSPSLMWISTSKGSRIIADQMQTTERCCCEMKALFSLCLFPPYSSVCFHLPFLPQPPLGLFKQATELMKCKTRGERERAESKIKRESCLWRVMFQEIHTAPFPGGPCGALFVPYSVVML